MISKRVKIIFFLQNCIVHLYLQFEFAKYSDLVHDTNIHYFNLIRETVPAIICLENVSLKRTLSLSRDPLLTLCGRKVFFP